MSRDIKIWLVIMAIYVGSVGGTVGLISRIEYPLEGRPIEVSSPVVANSITTPDYLVKLGGF